MRLLCDELQPIELTASKALRVELALNVSPHGHAWSTLGDRLYDWGIGRAVEPAFKVEAVQHAWVEECVKALTKSQS